MSQSGLRWPGSGLFRDVLGLYPAFAPKFAKRYAELGEKIVEGL